MRISAEPNAAPEDVEVVIAGLRAFNMKVIGDPQAEDLAFFLRDDDDRIVGGLLGQIRWRWAYVARLWVSDEHRGQGHGRALLEAAEARARDAGCLGIYLDTFEFQARPFYEKLGYVHFGTLDGYPPGYCQYFLSKRFPAYAD